MPQRFDPYQQWFSIPPVDQPPDHYRLLGLARFEAEPGAIERAANKRLEYLRTFQTSVERAECAWLMNEVERAQATLLDPRRKAVYDAMLYAAGPADANPAAAAASAAPAAAPTIGRFQVLSGLRSTRLASTFRVRDPGSGRVYALKMLVREAAGDKTFRKRFEREAEISSRLNHPNLITGYEVGQHGTIPYLVTEHVIGTDLQTLVERCGPFSVEQAIDLIEQAACGLGQLHLLGVHHRNVSPRNLLLDLRGRVRVTNLLLAGIEEGSELDGNEGLTRMGDAMGSSDFMAPEQAVDASKADQRADIYSLGCTLFFLLTGRLAYTGRSMMEKVLAHRTAPIPSLSDSCPDTPGWLDRAFRKMVAKDPADRYASMAEVSQDLAPRDTSLGSRVRRFFAKCCRVPSWWPKSWRSSGESE